MLHAREDYNRRIQDTADLIPKDEPVFLLRAHDMTAPSVVEFWANEAERVGAPADIVKLAREHRLAMIDWQAHHGAKSPDLPKR